MTTMPASMTMNPMIRYNTAAPGPMTILPTNGRLISSPTHSLSETHCNPPVMQPNLLSNIPMPMNHNAQAMQNMNYAQPASPNNLSNVVSGYFVTVCDLKDTKTADKTTTIPSGTPGRVVYSRTEKGTAVAIFAVPFEGHEVVCPRSNLLFEAKSVSDAFVRAYVDHGRLGIDYKFNGIEMQQIMTLNAQKRAKAAQSLNHNVHNAPKVDCDIDLADDDDDKHGGEGKREFQHFDYGRDADDIVDDDIYNPSLSPSMYAPPSLSPVAQYASEACKGKENQKPPGPPPAKKQRTSSKSKPKKVAPTMAQKSRAYKVGVKFVFTTARKEMVVDEAIKEGLFRKLPKDHLMCAENVRKMCESVDENFAKIDAAHVKKQLYAVQRAVAGTPKKKREELKGYMGALCSHLEKYNLISTSMYVHGDADPAALADKRAAAREAERKRAGELEAKRKSARDQKAAQEKATIDWQVSATGKNKKQKQLLDQKITTNVTVVTGAVVAGIDQVWPDDEKKVGKWTREDFCDLMMDIDTPQNVYFQKVCGLKAAIDNKAAWSAVKRYVLKMAKLEPSSKEEAE